MTHAIKLRNHITKILSLALACLDGILGTCSWYNEATSSKILSILQELVMTESQSTTQANGPKTKKVSIQERSVLVGDTIFVNGSGVNLALLRQRFLAGGYQVQETPHFLLLRRSEAPSTILVHWFDPQNIDADVKHYVALELQPLGLLPTSQHYGEILAGIVGSGFPEDARRAWKYFGANTLQRFLIYLSTASAPPYPDYTVIGSFATQYQRVCELSSGKTFLDAGCESGFLPLLIAERMPFVERVVGLDIRPDMFDIAREIAEDRQLHSAQFIQSDLLAEDFSAIGQFDTVAAIGVIEHFVSQDMYCVLSNLLQITKQRLIITVPYGEETPTVFYGHEQLFTPASLENLGKWGLEQIGGAGKMWIEECVGGLLLIERD